MLIWHHWRRSFRTCRFFFSFFFHLSNCLHLQHLQFMRVVWFTVYCTVLLTGCQLVEFCPPRHVSNLTKIVILSESFHKSFSDFGWKYQILKKKALFLGCMCSQVPTKCKRFSMITAVLASSTLDSTRVTSQKLRPGFKRKELLLFDHRLSTTSRYANIDNFGVFFQCARKKFGFFLQCAQKIENPLLFLGGGGGGGDIMLFSFSSDGHKKIKAVGLFFMVSLNLRHSYKPSSALYDWVKPNFIWTISALVCLACISSLFYRKFWALESSWIKNDKLITMMSCEMKLYNLALACLLGFVLRCLLAYECE